METRIEQFQEISEQLSALEVDLFSYILYKSSKKYRNNDGYYDEECASYCCRRPETKGYFLCTIKWI